jgi:hypothetical protein
VKKRFQNVPFECCSSRRYGTGLLMSAMSTPLAVPMLRDGVDNGWARSNAACVVICVGCVAFTAGWTWRRELLGVKWRGV